tara:strand:+ start:638 stop:847 length:210 start_codon:yes stop_codon:yes gene_type:complete
MAKAEKKQNIQVEFTPEQKRFQAHIQSLTNKINEHQFEIEQLMPSLNTYQQALQESMKKQTDNIEEEKE